MAQDRQTYRSSSSGSRRPFDPRDMEHHEPEGVYAAPRRRSESRVVIDGRPTPKPSAPSSMYRQDEANRSAARKREGYQSQDAYASSSDYRSSSRGSKNRFGRVSIEYTDYDDQNDTYGNHRYSGHAAEHLKSRQARNSQSREDADHHEHDESGTTSQRQGRNRRKNQGIPQNTRGSKPLFAPQKHGVGRRMAQSNSIRSGNRNPQRKGPSINPLFIGIIAAVIAVIIAVVLVLRGCGTAQACELPNALQTAAFTSAGSMDCVPAFDSTPRDRQNTYGYPNQL